MQIKVLFAGEGTNIPYVGIGLSFAGFKLWTGEPFMGFTSATNQALFGFSIVETPVINLGPLDPELEAWFRNLHGRIVFVKIEPTLFFRDGGIATIAITVKEQSGGELVDHTIEFVAENCRGISAVAGPIEFSTELLQLPEDEWSPYGSVIP